MQSVDLPKPSAAELALSQQMQQYLQQQIQQAGGWLEFSRFMEASLYAPALGYYQTRYQPIGEQGDFITAPEISPLFSRTLARPLATLLEPLPDACILEFGAGSGKLAYELLLALDQLQVRPRVYYILELSPALREQQQQQLQQLPEPLYQSVQWLDHLPAQVFNGVVLANEVLDAMPVERFSIQEQQALAWGVTERDNELQLEFRPAPAELANQLERIQQDIGFTFPDNYAAEVNLYIQPWLQSLYQILHQGMVLLMDYGYGRKEYYLPERSMGTFMCYYRHHAFDNPLWHPGIIDMTAFVDFTAVAEAALEAGFALAGYTSQGHFLMDAGLAEVMQQQPVERPQEQLQLNQQIKTLTLPSEMGERFKVMLLGKQLSGNIPGFSGRDYRHSL